MSTPRVWLFLVSVVAAGVVLGGLGVKFVWFYGVLQVVP